jgi:hypothetical protein
VAQNTSLAFLELASRGRSFRHSFIFLIDKYDLPVFQSKTVELLYNETEYNKRMKFIFLFSNIEELKQIDLSSCSQIPPEILREVAEVFLCSNVIDFPIDTTLLIVRKYLVLLVKVLHKIPIKLETPNLILIAYRTKYWKIYDVDKQNTIKEIMERIYDKEGIPPEIQELYFHRVKLDPTKTLGYYNIHLLDTLDLKILPH